ncbi:DUF2911 domain-containing protein [Parasediminibacterium sp. JCM 36343]|uniref:DUF2911 domain-containing protein n=1 Tax=Parasediminibacterium sp. JCM 36343 TaxID=3374279 RepID=UPI00397CE427
MKNYILFSVCLCIAFATSAQQKPTELDKSPMDMSYWPANYPLLKLNGKAKDGPVARIVYSRPIKNNRTIFDSLVKYNEVWRLGANEATEVEFFKPVKIGGKPVPKGRYTIFCIPNEARWTLIINKDNYCWGSFIYDSKKDLLRTDVPAERNSEVVEAFTIYFEEVKTGANLIVLWDNLKAALPISL